MRSPGNKTLGRRLQFFFTFLIILFFFTDKVSATYSWKQKANFGGTARTSPASFSINGKGYIGTGYDMSANKKDFWEFDPATNVWTQKADFGGVARHGAASFAIGNKGYVGVGAISYPAYNFNSDFWEYDPTGNTWTQKGDFPGNARYLPFTFVIGNKGYLGAGWDQATPYYKDFWEYDPASDLWTQKADFGGTARTSAIGFAINGKGYAGTGYDNSNKSDMWEYNPTSNSWTAKANFPSPARYGASAFIIGSDAFVGSGGNGTTFYTDFYRYDPLTNFWTAIQSFTGTGRRHTGAFTIGQTGYVGAGAVNGGGTTNTFYEYSLDVDGIDEIRLDESLILLSPNPVLNILTVSTKIKHKEFQELKIFNVEGKLIYDSPFESTTSEVNVSGFPKGVYFIELISVQNEILCGRFLKE